MKPIKLKGPEEMFKILGRCARGEYDKFSREDQLKAKIIQAFIYADAVSKRLEAVNNLIRIASGGEDCTHKAMDVFASMYDKCSPEDELNAALLDQLDRIKEIDLTCDDPDEGFVRQLPNIVREIMEPSESFSNRVKKGC